MLVAEDLSFLDPMNVAFDFRKYFSGEELSKQMADVFSEVADPRIQGKVKIAMTDTLMSAFAIYSLKVPSLLSFDTFRFSENHRQNLKTLYEIVRFPNIIMLFLLSI